MVIVKAFVNEKSEYGNPVGIVIDELSSFSPAQRQDMAVKSGLSEIVFINNLAGNDISIFSPTREIPFAGHAVAGTAFFLDSQKNEKCEKISSMGTEITVSHEGKIVWVRGELSTMPKWNFRKLESPKDVDEITIMESALLEHCVVWSWIDEKASTIRARTFASDWLILEDEANGSGSMLLAHDLSREIKVYHGKGSLIYARPFDAKCAEVGGYAAKL